MLAREIRTEIEIAAPPQAVWDVLAELEHWSEWNRVVLGLRLRGPLREGTRGRLTLQLPPPVGPRSLSVELVAVRAPHELAWQGGIRGVVRGRHGFVLEPTEHGTRLVHTERFSGLAVPPVIAVLRSRLLEGYHRLNEGLRRRCETH
ncbi:MAG: SRPBCC domain-containing protein [Myxococcales bacterium]|nr:SRPBCC domain-containing protein [Myxococcales bacterium]MCB9712364.1 SRPBCC domain-containing protein [Myxococcales bacterium]